MVDTAHPSDHNGSIHNLGARDGPAYDVAVGAAFLRDQKMIDFDICVSHYSDKDNETRVKFMRHHSSTWKRATTRIRHPL